MKRGFAKKVIIKLQRQITYGLNFYESDFVYSMFCQDRFLDAHHTFSQKTNSEFSRFV